MREELYQRLRAFIENRVPEFMRETKLPGLSISVVHDGEVVYEEGFGARDPARNLPATPDTLYGIGSCTKSFVAMAIMQLEEQGKLSLDDPAYEYIPLELGSPDEPIRIHNLLTHTLGLPSLATSSVALYRGIGLDTGVPWGGVNDFYRLVNGARNEIVTAPGRRFFYHNAAYRMLGHIIQEVGGVPFHRYVTERIVRPLGMERTTMVRSEYERDSDRMVPHWKKLDGSLEPSEFPYPDVEDSPDFSFIAAAGGLISSVRELTKYLMANMNGGAYGEVRLVSQESVERMQRGYIDRGRNYHGDSRYGYGWEITEDFHGHRMISHGGSILVSTAHLAFVPDLGAGVAIGGNSASGFYSTICEGIFATILDKDPSEAVPALAIRERMDRLTGSYEIYKGLSKVIILKKEGMLYLEERSPFNESQIPLIPMDSSYSEAKFHIHREGLNQQVEFKIQPDGGVDLYMERYVYHKKGL